MTAAHLEPGFLSLGQPVARAVVLRAAAGGRLQRTLLVHGPAGAGKAAFVDDLLALAFCQTPVDGYGPCNVCRGCRDARARAHPDLLIGSPGAWREGRSTGESIVAAARHWLLEASGTPVAGERRVIVVEQLDAASEQIQNALLKALEEPGERHMFILVADEATRVLPTIRSRAQALRIGPVDRRELAAWLMEHERLPSDQADALARISGGLAGTANGLARSPDRVAWRRRVQAELLRTLDEGRAARFSTVRDLLDEASRMVPVGPGMATDGEDGAAEAARPVAAAQRGAAMLLVEAWRDLARDLLVAGAGTPALAPAQELLPDLAALAARVPRSDLAALVRFLERVHDGLAQNAAPRLALEAAMLRWPEPRPDG